MPPAYRFVDRWVVAAPIERVYDTIGDVRGYERWWTDFVLRATGDEPPPAPGKRNELLVKAYLPYKVNFGLEVIEAERPRRILSRAFEGLRRHRRVDAGGNPNGTVATLDWRPSVNHALIRHLTPVLRPLSARTTTGRCVAESGRSADTSARPSLGGGRPNAARRRGLVAEARTARRRDGGISGNEILRNEIQHVPAGAKRQQRPRRPRRSLL